MKRIGYILERFPSLTERFILRELEELHRRGVEPIIFALSAQRLPDDESFPEFLTNVTIYSPRILSPKLFIAQLSFLIRSPSTYIKTMCFMVAKNISRPRDLISAMRHFPFAVYFAGRMKRLSIEHIHAHFSSLPTTIALIASKLLMIDFSFTAHAWDLYVSSMMLNEKLRSSKFVITCNDFNLKYLTEITARRYTGKMHRIYHGLDVGKYSSENFNVKTASRFDETLPAKEDGPFILSVGRLEIKKGFPYLIEACRLLKERGIEFSCCIIGEGREENALKTQINTCGLSKDVLLMGALSEKAVMESYARSDIFVLSCVTANDGDHDGLPNVLIEALAMEVATISTSIGGIPELIEHDNTGLLVPEKDSPALALAIESLINNKKRREQLSRNGRERVTSMFDIRNNIVPLIELLQAN